MGSAQSAKDHASQGLDKGVYTGKHTEIADDVATQHAKSAQSAKDHASQGLEKGVYGGSNEGGSTESKEEDGAADDGGSNEGGSTESKEDDGAADDGGTDGG